MMGQPKPNPESARDPFEGWACVVVLEGDRPGRRVCFERELVIGRGCEANLALMGSKVSRKHAALRFRPVTRTWELADLGSKNGTFIGDEPIRRQRIGYGDRFRVGGTLLLLTHYDRIEERLQRQRKLEVAGRMGAGVAHDFNNLLGIIASSLDYLDGCPEDASLDAPDVKACHADIRTVVERAKELTGQLLNFATGKEDPLVKLSAAEVVREVATLVGRTFDDRIALTTKIGDEAPIYGRRGQLHQALMNLCLNARDAMLPEGGLIELEVDLDAGFTDDPRIGSPHVRVSVRDDGCGVDAATRDRLFEPFFTTKGRHGTGLGLANVLEAMIDHGGTVEVESERGEGSEFILRFPTAATASRVFSGGALIARKEPSYPISVLIADDEPSSRKSMGRVVEHLGHHCTLAADGEEVLELLFTNPRFGLVILDYDMPNMDGERCFTELRERYPELRVAFASGSLTNERRERLLADGAVAVFDKPFEVRELEALLERVSEVLRAVHTTNVFEVGLERR
jgi:two-component system, cell cycle sensor histidine kinase and response regulator CckA